MPDTPIKPTDIEAHLLARLKLQRVIFGACALVLVTLAVLGMSAYRNMQRDVKSARDDALVADGALQAEAARSSELKQAHEQAGAEVQRQKRALALEKCRLAAQDFAQGQESRARTLFQEALALGPPPWAPLLQRELRPDPARFAGSSHADAAVACGALSGDRNRLGVVRIALGRVSVLEIYDVREGKLLFTVKLPEASDSGDLHLDARGERFLVRHGGRLVGGAVDGEAAAVGASGPDTVDPQAWTHLSVRDNLAELASARPGEVSVYPPGAARPVSRPLPTDSGELKALQLLARQGVAVIAGNDVLAHQGAGWEPLYRFRPSDPPIVAALFDAGTALFAAALTGRAVELVSIPLDAPGEADVRSHQLSPVNWTRMSFLADGTLLCLGAQGAAALIGPDGLSEWSLGGDAVSFGALGPDGLVFGNERGELSMRLLQRERQLGFSLLCVPPAFAARAATGGFVVTSRGGTSRVWGQGQWHTAGKLARAVPAGASFAGADGEKLVLPWGGQSTVEREGVLLGAWASGKLLLYKAPNELVSLGKESRRTQFSAPTTPPEEVAFAASAPTAALRYRDSLYVVNELGNPDPHAIAAREGLTPDRMALSADGLVLALTLGQLVTVVSVQGPAEHTLRTGVPPQAVALLFGGTVLATIERLELVFYEVATGRVLTRKSATAEGMHAGGDAALHLVEGGKLRILRFPD